MPADPHTICGDGDDLLLDAFVDDTGGSLDDVAESPLHRAYGIYQIYRTLCLRHKAQKS